MSDRDSARIDEQLRGVHEALAELDASLSRHVRTPLTLLLGPLNDILASPASALVPGSRASLETARRSALRLLQLLDTIRDHRGAAKVGPVDESAFDLGSFTAHIATYFGPACEAAGLRLVTDCPPLAAGSTLDRVAWEAIVVNLVANAVKTTAEGSITVRLRHADGDAQLTVTDTGPGIAERDLQDVFARVTPTLDSGGSVGVGLPFVADLVKQHGGSIEVHSSDGHGTTFTARVPLERPPLTARVEEISSRTPDAAMLPSSSPVPAEAVSQRGYVVIAEDQEETRAYLCHVLERAGFSVDALADGQAALSTCQLRAPDVLVSDVLMPGLNGFELIERLRNDERTSVIPVLLLSARGGEESRIEGIAAGADDYLVKPLSSRELVARVDGAVRLGRLRRDVARREQADLDALLAMASRLVDVQEAERRQLSTELHDRTSPQLAAIQINLKMLGHLLRDRESEDIAALLDDTVHLIGETTAGIREISSDLRPAVLDDGGLLPALAAYTQQFSQRTGIQVALDTGAAPVTPPAAAVQSSLFRIVQEALTNCVKHAQATTVTIRLGVAASGELTLLIADDGVGFDLDEQSTTGLGLLTMKERAEFLGGHFAIRSRRGEGTQIMVRL